MPQVEGWRLESGEHCFSPMTAAGPGTPACWLLLLGPVLLFQRGALDWEGRLRQDTYQLWDPGKGLQASAL